MSSELHPEAAVVAPDVDPAEIENRLRRECYDLVLPGVSIDLHADLFEIGGDSIILIRLVSMAQLAFGVELNALRYFQHPTLATLVAEVGERLAQSGADEQALGAILAQVESMSDDEVLRLLDEQAQR